MFSAHTRDGLDLRWDDRFDGDARLVERVLGFVTAGRPVATVETGPVLLAATRPEWMAYFTARAALADYDPDAAWDTGAMSPRPNWLDVPKGAVA